jgi:hypothetical protein
MIEVNYIIQKKQHRNSGCCWRTNSEIIEINDIEVFTAHFGSALFSVFKFIQMEFCGVFENR